MAVLIKKGTTVYLYEPITNRVARIPTPDAMREIMSRLGLSAPRAVDRIPGKVVGMQALLRDIPGGVTAAPVQPGLQHEQFLLGIGLEEFIANLQADLQREQQADARRLQEAQLGANPADFVAFELYKRSLEEQGFTPQSAARSDVEIQDIFGLALGLNEGVSLGTGQFGVDIPTTQSISRSELQGFNPTDIGILSSFLRGGVETDGGFQGINPEDFFTELEEGLIPTLTPRRTQFRL